MNGDSIPLRDVLKISKVYIPVLDKELYPYAVLHPYPNGLSQKGHKKGTDLRTKQQKTIHQGQFVISKTRVHQRYWGIVQPELDGAIVHRSYLSFDIHPDLKSDYFAVYLSTTLFRRSVLAARTKQGRLDLRRFGRILIPLPPLDDQSHIAGIWDYALKALNHTSDMSASIEELKAGVASDLFHKATLSSMSRPLGRCAVIGDDLSSVYPFYVTTTGKVLRNRPIIDEDVIGVLPDAELDSHFVQYYLETQKMAWFKSASKHTRMSLVTALQALEIPLPSAYEQRKIASLLQQHDDVLQKLKLEYQELRHLTQGMMQQIFSGSLPLSEAVSLLRTL